MAGKTRKPKAVEAWALVASPKDNFCDIGVWTSRAKMDAFLAKTFLPNSRKLQECHITYTLTPIRRSRK